MPIVHLHNVHLCSKKDEEGCDAEAEAEDDSSVFEEDGDSEMLVGLAASVAMKMVLQK